MVSPRSNRSNNVNAQQRLTAQQIRQGGATSTFFDELLGIQGHRVRGLSNINLRTSAGQLAGQRSAVGDLTEEQQNAVSQFTNPSFTGQQQTQLEALAKRAAGQGLIGGAPRGQIQDLAQLFQGGNRAQAFQTLQGVVSGGVQDINQRVNPFLQQAGLFGGAVAGGLNAENVRAILGAGGQTGQQFRQFANPAINALAAVGLGGDAFAALAQRSGAQIGQGGVSGNRDVGDAFLDFLAPSATGGRQFILDRLGLPQRSRVGRSHGFGTLARTQNRAGAAEFLGSEVQSRARNIREQGAEFQVLGGAAQAFNIGGPEGRSRLRDLSKQDFSRFGELFQNLGIQGNPELEAGRRRNGGSLLSGRFLPGNSPLFRQIV